MRARVRPEPAAYAKLESSRGAKAPFSPKPLRERFVPLLPHSA
jgi:hypothetical protein